MVKYMNYISNVFSYIYSVFNKPTNNIHIDESSINEPISSEPIISEPIISEPIISEPIISEPIISEPISSEPIISEPTITEDASKECVYIFINTANIYNASKLMFKKLKNEEYNNKYIKIYLLKSHKLEPLFKKPLIVNKYNLELIKIRLSKSRRHLHTLIEAIDSFIEYNNIKNYSIYY
jgi:hypothetical protein